MLELIFQELSRMPDGKRPELLVRWHPTLPAICRKYPRVNVVGSGREDEEVLGALAAETLVEHLATGGAVAVIHHRQTTTSSPAPSLRRSWKAG